MNGVFFDVGANDGSSSINIARQNPSVTVWAFEPTPKLADDLRAKTADLKNYKIIMI